MPELAHSPTLITTLPLTAEAREDLLDGLFAEDLPHYGELFVPGNSFYVHGTSHTQAQHMVKNLCSWLGVKPGYVGIEYESQPNAATEGQRYSIYLESRVVKDEFLLAATLAHALVRYLLEERKQIHLLDPSEQLSLVATGTVVFGLGIVAANGLRPGKSHTKDHQELLGTIPLSEYMSMLHGFLWQRAVPEHAYVQNLAPWVAQLLNVPRAKKPVLIVKQQYHTDLQKRFERIGLIWILLLGVCIGSFVLFQRVKPTSREVKKLQQQIVELQELKQSCNDSILYNRQYADMTDIQTVRSINAEELRCKSLENQLISTQQTLEKTK